MRLGVSLAAGLGAIWLERHATAPAVRGWSMPDRPRRRLGALDVGIVGDGHTVVVLLHGLVATGDVFGTEFDVLGERATLLVPDLLGFGRSLDDRRGTFTADDHIEALDDMLRRLGLDDRPLVIGAHSMGAAVAVRWAARRGAQVEAVVGFGAPAYPPTGASRRALAAAGPLARLFVADTAFARAACAFNCRHRTIAGVIAAALTPRLPIPIARAASRHTWSAYHDSLELTLETDWVRMLDCIASTTSVDLLWGDRDRIGDPAWATSQGVVVEIVADADHHLPMTHPSRCVERLPQRP